jgi:hypothetical protein
MAADLTPGYTFGATETLTADKLRRLVDDGTLSGSVSRTDASAATAFVTIGSVQPGAASDKAGELWFDTGPSGNNGILRASDGAQWVPVGEGFLAANQTGSTITAGKGVKYDSSADSPADRRIYVTPVTSNTDEPLGVMLADMDNGATGIVLTDAKVLTVNKTSGTAVTKGDAVVPTSTAGSFTTNNISGWGNCFGSSAVGIWTADAASNATTGQALLFRSRPGTFITYRDNPNTILSASSISAVATWSGSFGTPTFVSCSSAPAGTVARIVRVELFDVTAAATKQGFVALRNRGSSTTVPRAVAISGTFQSGGASPADHQRLSGILHVPGAPGTNNQLEFYVNSDGTLANLRLSIHEVGLVVGGRVN